MRVSAPSRQAEAVVPAWCTKGGGNVSSFLLSAMPVPPRAPYVPVVFPASAARALPPLWNAPYPLRQSPRDGLTAEGLARWTRARVPPEPVRLGWHIRRRRERP
ncbi:hypothetical protein GCM10010156_14200 [Planobispora rosea]|uniref:Uncharacterized protein n=1 Tax=Planobispora rosea TaxID=35762 RepID=A0A8J3WC00_PLARO|nr:hypothetical protein GCM10010156_14200 [Planobispora rosea]GIH83508.1 hypothetical protein Pro02_19160 [Planobispora rosea]